MAKNCGTCREWNPPGRGEDFGDCQWSVPDLPFWAQVDDGENNRATLATYGDGCRAYLAKD